MPKLEVDGLEEFGSQLEEALNKSTTMLKVAVYDGAHEVFEEVKARVEKLPTADTKGAHRDLTPKQKAGLLSGLYGSRIITDNGGVYVYIGFTGYNDVKTKDHPKGQPNIMIARSVESGGSHMNKRPFMKQAANAAKKKAVEAMQKTFEQELQKL